MIYISVYAVNFEW